jgi:predicted nuclease of restriction endonuclease-like (RecB) superfamily
MKNETKPALNVRDYAALLTEVKTRIRSAQVRATLSANGEMLAMYWDIGRMFDRRQKTEGWGAGVIPRLSRDIRNELPEVKGFSVRNIKLMTQFYRAYPSVDVFLPQAAAESDSSAMGKRPVARLPELSEKGQPSVAQFPASENVPQAVAQLPWAHHVILMQKVKDLPTRYWYMAAAVEQGWSRDVLISRKGFTAEARGAYADTKHVSLVDLADGGMTRKGLGLSPPQGSPPPEPTHRLSTGWRKRFCGGSLYRGK